MGGMPECGVKLPEEYPELSAGFMQICVLSALLPQCLRQDSFPLFPPHTELPAPPQFVSVLELLAGLAPEPAFLGLAPALLWDQGLGRVTRHMSEEEVSQGAGKCPFSALQTPMPQAVPISPADSSPVSTNPSPMPIHFPPAVHPSLKAPIRANPSREPFSSHYHTQPRPGPELLGMGHKEHQRSCLHEEGIGLWGTGNIIILAPLHTYFNQVNYTLSVLHLLLSLPPACNTGCWTYTH